MRLRIFCIILAVFMCSGSVSANEEKQEPENLLLKEMAAIDRAFKATIDGLVLNQPDKIAPAYDEVQKIREQMEQAVKEGRKITLPKNQSMYAAFLKIDRRFHRDVEILLDAAKGNRRKLVYRQTYRLLNMCIRCHAVFRK